MEYLSLIKSIIGPDAMEYIFHLSVSVFVILKLVNDMVYKTPQKAGVLVVNKMRKNEASRGLALKAENLKLTAELEEMKRTHIMRSN